MGERKTVELGEMVPLNLQALAATFTKYPTPIVRAVLGIDGKIRIQQVFSSTIGNSREWRDIDVVLEQYPGHIPPVVPIP